MGWKKFVAAGVLAAAGGLLAGCSCSSTQSATTSTTAPQASTDPTAIKWCQIFDDNRVGDSKLYNDLNRQNVTILVTGYKAIEPISPAEIKDAVTKTRETLEELLTHPGNTADELTKDLTPEEKNNAKRDAVLTMRPILSYQQTTCKGTKPK